jgi:hypothetical protein
LSPPSDLVYLDEPWLAVFWDHDYQCVYAKYHSCATSAEFRVGTMRILAALRKRRAGSLVSDNRMLESVSAQDQLWIRDTWVPLAVESGLKRIAVILAKRSPGSVGSGGMAGQIGKNEFVMQTFDSLPDALNWVGCDRTKL